MYLYSYGLQKNGRHVVVESHFASTCLNSSSGSLKAAWSLKTRALTEMVYIDEVDVDQEGIAEMMLDESAIAQVAREYFNKTFNLYIFYITPF